jgi:hypothetical protein
MTFGGNGPPPSPWMVRGVYIRTEYVKGGTTMGDTELIILIVVLVLLFGGGGGYYWSRGRR